jgi:hypothetical protein
VWTEKLNPWDRIQFEEQEWFWDDTTTPWSNKARFEHEMNRLQDFGVTALPRLVETLPYLVLRDDLTSIDDAVDLLRALDISRNIFSATAWICDGLRFSIAAVARRRSMVGLSRCAPTVPLAISGP